MNFHRSFPDFVLFLYVHLSHADSSYDPSEMSIIKEHMKNLFDDNIDFEKKLYQTIRHYNSFEKADLGEFLQSSADYFRSEKPDPKVMHAFQAIVNADGKVDQNEVNVLNTLKQIIGV